MSFTQSDDDVFSEIQSHFEHCLENIENIRNGFGDPEMHMEWLIRDNSSFNGYQNDAVLRSFKELKEIYDRIKEEE